MGDIFVGQVGVKFSLDTEDYPALLAQATKTEIWVTCRAGKFKWPATLEDTVVSYTTRDVTDLPCSGDYRLQAYVEGDGWKIPGDIVIVNIKRPTNTIEDITTTTTAVP